jgi:hypothetical protein
MIFHKQFKGLAILFSVALITPALALAGASTFQSADLQHWVGGAPALGGGTLNRSANSVQVRVTATGLEATTVYSAWFIIFNAPENCAGGPGNCMVDDVGPKDTGVLNAGGFISGADGSGYLTGTMGNGAAPDGMCCFGRLMNGNNAEIHIVVQTHGAPVPGTVGFEMSHPTGPNADRYFMIFPAM